MSIKAAGEHPLDFHLVFPDHDPSLYHDGGEKAEDIAVYEGGAIPNYAGGSNLLYLPSDTYYTLKALYHSNKNCDYEEFTDATMRMIGIPMNFVSAAGTIAGYGVGFGIIPKINFITPLTVVAGSILCIVEGIVDSISLSRQIDFEEEFDFELLSHLRNMVDYADEKTAKNAVIKMSDYIEKNPDYLARFVGKEQAEIIKSLMSEIQEKIEKNPELLPSILNHYRPALEEVSRQVLIPNLRSLRNDYLHVNASEIHDIYESLKKDDSTDQDLETKATQECQRISTIKKKRLARRIRPWMVEEANKTVDPLLAGIVKNDPEAIREGLRLADDIHMQSYKKKLVHILGIVVLAIATVSLIVMVCAVPASISFILAGIAMTFALVRAGVFSGTLDSRGWTFEPQKILPEFIRKRIFKDTPRFPEIKHRYVHVESTVRSERKKYDYDTRLNLDKTGLENFREKKVSGPLPQLSLYV